MAAGKVYQSLDGLFDDISLSLSEDTIIKIGDEAAKIFRKSLDTNVYDRYTRVENGWIGHETYWRRFALERNITREIEDDRYLVISSNASPMESVITNKSWSFDNNQDGDEHGFIRLIESGNLGFWLRTRNINNGNPFPRPFINSAQIEVDNSPVINALINNSECVIE